MGELRVIATAGHVDHGKSSLIAALTGMDPDRLAEEKRRGLTIDLGYAWSELPGGRDVGFVDVPGHERFITNMLAGVGPVRLVLFIVAADEGWKPQSEEHLQILDVLGIEGGVVALTKTDLVDDERLAAASDEVTDRVAGTGLEDSPIVPVSSTTGLGVDDVRAALGGLLAAANAPTDTRARLFVDRVFTIRGSGTVVTGTLTGGCLDVGQQVRLFPVGTARIRGLQTHRRAEDRACPVVRVAANLSNVDRSDIARGDVLAPTDTWRATQVFEAELRPVRGLAHPVTSRGAFKVYVGASEVDATLRFLGSNRLEPDGRAFARIRIATPLPLDVFDRLVLRDAGRRETVAGGTVLDPAPPGRPGADAADRLTRRAEAARDDLPGLLTDERGAVLAAEAALLTGSQAVASISAGPWFVQADLRDRVEAATVEALTRYHEDHPLGEGMALGQARAVVSDALSAVRAPNDPGLVDALLDDLRDRGVSTVSGGAVRLSDHLVELAAASEDVERLVGAIGGAHEAKPPTVKELQGSGIGREVIDAAARAGYVVRVSSDLVFLPELVERAREIVKAAPDGITVSQFRVELDTSRKFALPLLEWFDQRGETRREGDLRFPRSR